MAYSIDVKEQLDPRLLPWAGVTSREMFGALCYFHRDKMFVILTGSSVAAKLSVEERQDALDNHGATEFVVKLRTALWPVGPVSTLRSRFRSIRPWTGSKRAIVMSSTTASATRRRQEAVQGVL